VVITDLTEPELRDRLGGRFDPDEVVTVDAVLRELAASVSKGDVVLAVAPPAASRLGRGARRVAEAARDRTVVVAVPR
jgi:hypothetical protein